MHAAIRISAFALVTLAALCSAPSPCRAQSGEAADKAHTAPASEEANEARSPKQRVKSAAWTLAALTVATWSTAGVFALQARIEDRRNDRHPAATFRDRRDRRRALAYGLLGVGALFAASAAITSAAAARITEREDVSLALSPLDSGGLLYLDVRF